MTTTVRLVVGEEDAGQRADAFLASQLDGVSRTLAAATAERGALRVNGVAAKASRRVVPGDQIEASIEMPPSLRAVAQDIPIDVVYEDADLAVIDKPAGLVVHPSAGHADGTLANAIMHRFGLSAGSTDENRPGIVHRLDKDTSGLIVVALNPRAQQSLQAQIAARDVERVYLALASGDVRPPAGTIDLPVGRDPKNRLRMAPYGLAARSARTGYRVDDVLGNFSLLHARLETGRTHQIRVHFSALGHPLAGDTLYGGPPIPGLDRQFLHATALRLRSPSSGTALEFSSSLPPELAGVLDALRREGGNGE